MSYRFLRPDPYLESKHLPERAESFFFTLEKDFGKIVFDELCVLKKFDGEFRLVYHHCYENGACRLGGQDETETIRQIEHLIDALLKRGLLADHEGVFDLKREGRVFDAMIHLGEYFFALNNTVHSMRTMEERFGISRGGVIGRIREYCRAFESE